MDNAQQTTQQSGTVKRVTVKGTVGVPTEALEGLIVTVTHPDGRSFTTVTGKKGEFSGEFAAVAEALAPLIAVSGKVTRPEFREGKFRRLAAQGVPVDLLDERGLVVGHGVSDSSGAYRIMTSRRGKLTVKFPQALPPQGRGFLKQPSFTIDIPEEEKETHAVGAVHYEWLHAQVGVWVNDGHQGIEGIKVRLAVPADTEQPVHEDTTDGAGFCHFSAPPGLLELEIESPTTDAEGHRWELPPGCPATQSFSLQAGQTVQKQILLRPEEHTVVWTVTVEGEPAPGILVQVVDEATGKHLYGEAVTDDQGQVRIKVPQAGTYRVLVHADDRYVRAPVEKVVEVSSEIHGSTNVTLSAPGVAAERLIFKPVQQAVTDTASYPTLVQEVQYPGAVGAPAVPGMAPLGQIVENVLRDVLGWRPRADPKGFTAALSQSFTCKEVEGRTICTYNPRTYAVQLQADKLAVTGAQASIWARAKSALDQVLPLLDGLYALRVDADPEDIAAIRAIVRSRLEELVSELGVEGGPRVQRVSELFEMLLGPYSATVDSEHLTSGQLQKLQRRFGLERKLVNTVEEEQNLTNFFIIVDHGIALRHNWESQKKYFDRISGEEPFLGTQLVLISRALTVIAETVHEVYLVMDSVFLGAADRQTLELSFGEGRSPMFVSELLDWVERFASEEGPGLIEDGDKDGVNTVVTTCKTLRDLVTAALASNQPPTNPLPANYKSTRVQRALEELAVKLDQAYDQASSIEIRTQ